MPAANLPPPEPLPLPHDTGAVLLYGGVFDPPHIAHIQLPHLVRESALPGGWLVYIPASQSPLKSAAAASDQHRLAMLQLAIAPLDRALIWTDELDRAAAGRQPSYWIDTLRRARQVIRPAAKLAFLIGADQVADFHRWRDYREILRLAQPLVMLRPPLDSPDRLRDRLAAAGAWTPAEIEDWLSRIVPAPLMEVNATALREQLAAGAQHLRELAPEVLHYIRTHHLYGTPSAQ